MLSQKWSNDTVVMSSKGSYSGMKHRARCIL